MSPPLAGKSCYKNISQRSFSSFLLVGGLATGFHYALTGIFVWLGWLTPITASAVGFCISAVFNYGANAAFTFKGDHRHARSFPRFAVTAASGCLINVALLSLLVSFGITFVIAQLLSTGAVFLWNYTINAIWTF